MSQKSEIVKCSRDSCKNLADFKVIVLNEDNLRHKASLNLCELCTDETIKTERAVTTRDIG